MAHPTEVSLFQVHCETRLTGLRTVSNNLDKFVHRTIGKSSSGSLEVCPINSLPLSAQSNPNRDVSGKISERLTVV